MRDVISLYGRPQNAAGLLLGKITRAYSTKGIINPHLEQRSLTRLIQNPPETIHWETGEETKLARRSEGSEAYYHVPVLVGIL